MGELVTMAFGGVIAARHHNPSVASRAFGRHGDIWRGMSAARQQVYDAKARVLRAEKQEALDEAIAAARERIRTTQADLDEQTKLQDVPCRFCACRLSLQERADFDSLWGDPRFVRSEVDAMKSDLAMPIGQLFQMEHDALAQAEQLNHRVIPLVLQWVSQVAAHRQHLRDCILRFEVAGEARFWKFLLAILWPSRLV